MKNFINKNFIIYEDNNYLAVNKPPKVYSIHDRDNSKINIYNILKNYYNKEVFLCHRLDFDTSGIIIFAKNKTAQKHLSFLFARKKVKKTYHAIVSGQHNFDNDIIKAPILFNKEKAKIDYKKGKNAQTIFNTLKIYKDYSFLECQTITGRTHQIRIHALYKKASLIGDAKYRGKDIFLSKLKKNYKKKGDLEELPIIKRAALHASKISFFDIDGEKEINIKAPYPKDFEVLLKYLNQFAEMTKF